jgi:hypothetical protein
MINIIIRDEAGNESPFTVSNNVADAILNLLSALEPSRLALSTRRYTSVLETVEQTKYKI